ncbi:MAG: MTH1187 family thiamine-binding protein [Methanophagales archaeon]|nr:MTH1187 family thiamine-binding protein [Methanophagales archaeon]RLG30207.1 MAG: thiamine-binding protein [Methanosarcinales archaeon]
MIIAEITVIPIGTKTASVSKYVAKAVDALKKLGLKPELTAMGTIFEAEEISVILKAFEAVHESVFEQGAERVVTTLRIDERRDKEGSIKQKVRSVTSAQNSMDF